MFVLIGSNIEAEHNTRRAVAALRGRFRVVRLSPAYRTAPVGDTAQADFVNVAAELDCERTPEEVQQELRALEVELGRQRDPARPSGPRAVDLDLVLVPGLVGRFGMLELPSPLLAREAFVAVPVADLAPGLQHPVLATSLRELALASVARSQRPPERLDLEFTP
jgi:2-amino-4-hydroxy-6-hydroxymethyldihydropteridine diphosphokinase